jgi:hypothetical protein
MEVHHSHSAPKKFTHYLWEFLMLFLAVFCGFLAENQREHIVERQREKEFIQSLVIDLKADTFRLGDIIQKRNTRALVLDSFIELLNKPATLIHSRYLYYYNSFSTRGGAFHFTPEDGTMQQLKNGGNLRLVKRSSVRDSILAYDATTRSMSFSTSDEEEIMDTYRNIAEGIFDGRVLNAMRDENNETVSIPDNDPPLRLNPDAIFRLTYRIHMLTVYNKTMRLLSKQMKQKATNLLALINKEYHLSGKTPLED